MIFTTYVLEHRALEDTDVARAICAHVRRCHAHVITVLGPGVATVALPEDPSHVLAALRRTLDTVREVPLFGHAPREALATLRTRFPRATIQPLGHKDVAAVIGEDSDSVIVQFAKATQPPAPRQPDVPAAHARTSQVHAQPLPPPPPKVAAGTFPLMLSNQVIDLAQAMAVIPACLPQATIVPYTWSDGEEVLIVLGLDEETATLCYDVAEQMHVPGATTAPRMIATPLPPDATERVIFALHGWGRCANIEISNDRRLHTNSVAKSMWIMQNVMPILRTLCAEDETRAPVRNHIPVTPPVVEPPRISIFEGDVDVNADEEDYTYVEDTADPCEDVDEGHAVIKRPRTHTRPGSPRVVTLPSTVIGISSQNADDPVLIEALAAYAAAHMDATFVCYEFDDPPDVLRQHRTLFELNPGVGLTAVVTRIARARGVAGYVVTPWAMECVYGGASDVPMATLLAAGCSL